MPYYEYECLKCNHETEVFKSISEFDREELCNDCGQPMHRLISKGHFIYAGVQEAYFNHGLGCVVKNRKHKNEIAKQRGLVEVDNDKPTETVNHKPYEI